MRIRYSPKSRDDLMNIAMYIGADNPVRARTFVSELEEAVSRLADHPERFAVVRRVSGRALRRRPLANYSILYIAEPNEVQVIRVVSSWMDLDQALET